MLSLKTHVLITASLLIAILISAFGGGLLHQGGYLSDNSTTQVVARLVFFGLTAAFALSCVPLLVKLVLGAQVGLGNAGQPAVARALRNERIIVLALWGLIAAGVVIALPAMIADGFFSADPAKAIAETPSRGTLVARPELTIADMKRLSSLPLKGSAETVFADGNLFDFEIADSGIRFSRCRYYYITTFSGDRERIQNISVGTSQGKVTRGQLASLNADLRERLAADGWLMAYDKTRSEQDRRLHGGLAGRANHDIWLKADTVLRIMSRRLDDPKPGEDGARAGEWIQFVELSARQTYSGIEHYEFGKPQ